DDGGDVLGRPFSEGRAGEAGIDPLSPSDVGLHLLRPPGRLALGRERLGVHLTPGFPVPGLSVPARLLPYGCHRLLSFAAVLTPPPAPVVFAILRSSYDTFSWTYARVAGANATDFVRNPVFALLAGESRPVPVMPDDWHAGAGFATPALRSDYALRDSRSPSR